MPHLRFQKRIVAAATIWGNTVFKFSIHKGKLKEETTVFPHLARKLFKFSLHKGNENLKSFLTRWIQKLIVAEATTYMRKYGSGEINKIKALSYYYNLHTLKSKGSLVFMVKFIFFKVAIIHKKLHIMWSDSCTTCEKSLIIQKFLFAPFYILLESRRTFGKGLSYLKMWLYLRSFK